MSNILQRHNISQKLFEHLNPYYYKKCRYFTTKILVSLIRAREFMTAEMLKIITEINVETFVQWWF